MERPTHIEQQIELPFGESVRISFQSLKIRFGRSIITTAGITLGIAFLVSVWTNNEIDLAMQESGRTEQITSLGEEQEQGISTKDIWLIIMSLIVCVVGIANSMLMAVTERVQEIGTMKCLGALDSLCRTVVPVGVGLPRLVRSAYRCTNWDPRVNPSRTQEPRTRSLLLLPSAAREPRRCTCPAWYHCDYRAWLPARYGSIDYRRGFPGMACRTTSPCRSDAHRSVNSGYRHASL